MIYFIPIIKATIPKIIICQTGFAIIECKKKSPFILKEKYEKTSIKILNKKNNALFQFIKIFYN